MLSGKVTLREIESEAKRVYGGRFVSTADRRNREPDAVDAVILNLTGRRLLFEDRSKMRARRFALETLRKLPSFGGGA